MSTVPLAGLVSSLSIAVYIRYTSSFGILMVLSPVGLLDFLPGFLVAVTTGATGTGGLSFRLPEDFDYEGHLAQPGQ